MSLLCLRTEATNGSTSSPTSSKQQKRSTDDQPIVKACPMPCAHVAGFGVSLALALGGALRLGLGFLGLQ
eukprot:9726620-Alexandrium_andersonii.AAC.1